MRILIDIGHSAHVHNFRNLALNLIKDKHQVLWSVKNQSPAIPLLEYYRFKYKKLPRKKDRLLNKIFLQLMYDIILSTFCLRNKIDLMIGTSVTITHVSRLTGIKSVVFDDDDDDVQPFIRKYVHPFTDELLSPDCLIGKRARINTIYYPGYHELAYLHPKRFSPDPTVIKEIGITSGEVFFIMRFNVFKAHHDSGMKGLSPDQKLELINLLRPAGKIFITTEREIEPEFKPYQLKISPEKIHSLMYYSAMFIGDSQTMTSEAAVLGVPAIKCNSFAGKLSVPDELENIYHLCYSFLPEQFDLMVEKIRELISTPGLRQEWNIRKDKMLKDKIDVTAFWCWLIDNYPDSVNILKENPNYQERFR